MEQAGHHLRRGRMEGGGRTEEGDEVMAENSLIEWTDHKRCSKCGDTKPRDAFPGDRTRSDGLSYRCRQCRSTGRPKGWHGRPRINPQTGKPGPAPNPARDGDFVQARQRVNVEVRTGRRPHPNSIPCADCGHIWSEGERRHEYDHHKGYAAEHHLSVEPVCTICHHARESARG